MNRVVLVSRNRTLLVPYRTKRSSLRERRVEYPVFYDLFCKDGLVLNDEMTSILHKNKCHVPGTFTDCTDGGIEAWPRHIDASDETPLEWRF